jgi:hypothetical protein
VPLSWADGEFSELLIMMQAGFPRPTLDWRSYPDHHKSYGQILSPTVIATDTIVFADAQQII